MACHTSKSRLIHIPAPCSVCLDAVTDTNERSIAKLTCGHYFHLDCIGSAFNAKGSMQCPNCRHVESGRWLYANGCMQREWFTMEDIVNEEHDMLADVSQIILPFGLFVRLYGEWCPYEGSVAEVSFRGTGIASAEAAALTQESTSVDYPQSCPFFQAQGRNILEEHVASLEMMHAHNSVPEQVGPFRAQRSSTLAPSRSTWSREHQTMGDSMHLHHRSSRGMLNQPPTGSQPPIARRSAHYAEQHILTGSSHVSTSTNNVVRQAEPWEDAAFSQTSSSVWRQSPSYTVHTQHLIEPEAQRWAPPPLSGLHSLHGLQNSVPTIQNRYRPSDTEICNWYRRT